MKALVLVAMLVSMSACSLFHPPSLPIEVPSSRLAAFKACTLGQGGSCIAASRDFDPFAHESRVAIVPPPSIIEAAKADAWENSPARAQRARSFAQSGATSDDALEFLARAEARRDKLNADFNRFATHPFTRAMVGLHNALQGQESDAQPELPLGLTLEYLGLISELTTQDGWLVVAEDADRGNRDGAARTVYAIYLGVYLKAYFRNGEFGQINFDLADFYKRYPELLPYKTQLDPVLSQIVPGPFGKVGEGALIARTGRQLQFPPLEITVDPTKHTAVSVAKLDYPEIGADLVRVALEAIFDAHDRMPAVDNATGATGALFGTNPQLALAVFQPSATTPVPAGKLSTEQFTRTASYANSAEGAAATGVAQAIRGFNIAALNNEALAKAIEALVGTAVRKAVEKVTYCWYACVVNQDAMRSFATPGGVVSPWLPSDDRAGATLYFK